ncbi:hypothetical protein D3C72_2242430 [compost metagenome]
MGVGGRGDTGAVGGVIDIGGRGCCRQSELLARRQRKAGLAVMVHHFIAFGGRQRQKRYHAAVGIGQRHAVRRRTPGHRQFGERQGLQTLLFSGETVGVSSFDQFIA